MTIIVTGAARGIGRSATELLLSTGESVVGVDIDTSPLLPIQSSRFIAFEGDATDLTTIAEFCAAAGAISDVVASAGRSRPGPSATYPQKTWQAVIDINLTAVFNLMRVAAASAVDGASFVAISSVTAFQGFAGRAGYAATKAGVDAMVRSLAVEYAPKIRVNSIAPGFILTDIARRNLEEGHISEEAILERTPLARWGRPSDVAAAIQFLLSSNSSWITGATIPVDGGWLAMGLGTLQRDSRA